MTKLACLAIGAEVDAVLGGAAASAGWSTIRGAALALGAVLAGAAALLVVTRLNRPHLVLGVDSRGIILGPTLRRLMRRSGVTEPSRVIPWSAVRRVQVLMRESYLTDSGLSVQHRQLRVTTDDGWWIERALPTGTDLPALERVLQAHAGSTPVEVHGALSRER
jgi:hypothetical protein